MRPMISCNVTRLSFSHDVLGVVAESHHGQAFHSPSALGSCRRLRSHHWLRAASRIGHEEVKDKFKAKLDQVREHVRGILYEPHLVGEHSVEGGVMFASLLEEVCAAVNRRNKDIVPIR